MSKLKDSDGMKKLLGVISKRGMSKECQEILPEVASWYLDGKKEKDVMGYGISEEDKTKVSIIYRRLDEIKFPILGKAAGYLGKNARDLMRGDLFVDTTLNYLTKFSRDDSLKIALEDFVENSEYIDDEEKIVLTRKYLKGEKEVNSHEATQKLGKSAEFYAFIQGLNLQGRIK